MRFADRYEVESNRLMGWNYSENGHYFITICTRYHNNFLGKIVDEKMEYKEAGKICEKYIKEIPIHCPDIRLVDFVVMPNHVHILFHVETHDRASLQDNRKVTLINFGHNNHPEYFSRLSKKSNQIIPKVIKQFKSSVKREVNKHKLLFMWQERYYDEIVNDEKKLKTIIYYIKNNIRNWGKDYLFNSQIEKLRIDAKETQAR